MNSPCATAAATGFTPEPLLSAIPYLVGFQPADSLVCVFLSGDGLVRLTTRIGWDVCRIDPEECAAALWSGARRTGAGAVVLVAVDARPYEAEPLRVASTWFTGQGLCVLWSGRLDGSRWSSPECGARCDGDHRLARPSAMALELIAQGRSPVESRELVVAEVAPGDRISAAAVTAARVDEGDAEAWRDRTIGSLLDLLAVPRSLAPADVALVCAGSGDIRVRDVILWRLTVGPEHLLIGWEAAWRVVSDALRRSPEPHVAPVAAMGAVVAWQLGDGTRAVACLDRALAADPGHSLAALVRRSLEAGMPPGTWREVMSALDEQACRHGSGSVATRRTA